MAVLPLYKMIVLPDSTMMLRTDLYQTLVGRDPVRGEKVSVIIAKEETKFGDLSQDKIYPIGVTGFIEETGDQGFVKIEFSSRILINHMYMEPENQIVLETTPLEDVQDMDAAEARERFTVIRDEILAMSHEYKWGPMMDAWVMSWNNLGDIGASLSPWMEDSNDKMYELLEEKSRRARFEKLEAMLYEYIELSRVRIKATTDQKENTQKLYKEQALRKQIEYMQKELDEMHPDELSGIRKLELKIAESGMNETAKKEADKIINRLKAEGQQSQEAAMLTDYLEFLVSLPWKKEHFKAIDLDKAQKVLDADHFGLEKVKKRILEQIAVMQLKQEQSGSIILFVGAPGTGKTSIGQSIAKALDREYVRVSLGGVRDEADIRGHRRTYIGAMPGRIMDGIQKSGVSNPVMVLDEVDKLSMSYNGDPASALLEVLDPEQNSTFTDHYLNVPYDLSDVLFICTANSLETIPEPLLNRMEVIQFQSYTPTEKLQIAVRHLLPKAEKAAGLEEGDLDISEETISHIISEYTMESGVRGLKKRMDTISRSAAVKKVRGEETPIEVNAENLRDYMDMRPIPQKHVRDKAAPGVVTGLAWTQVGGDVLYIESTRMKGTGKLTITGQLGDVMKESAQIALSLVRNLYADQIEDLEKQDIHIHVPDGATPKDGPSAGITLTTALSSLFTGIPVTPHVAMTGEVSLQGRVNPIGGLPEKLMAAQRAGVTKVFIPKDNVEDLRDVADEVKEKLEIVPVEYVTDVLSELNLYEKAEEESTAA
ncbi:MAG: endopeptidase La [Anaerovoracaceae bacterium]|nr:endopeptidase La [Bacillota bacterium]MDY2670048.1 endopeptidase La [Anaerovoracaceae bacterium]